MAIPFPVYDTIERSFGVIPRQNRLARLQENQLSPFILYIPARTHFRGFLRGACSLSTVHALTVCSLLYGIKNEQFLEHTF